MKRALLPECQFDLTLIAFGFKALINKYFCYICMIDDTYVVPYNIIYSNYYKLINLF